MIRPIICAHNSIFCSNSSSDSLPSLAIFVPPPVALPPDPAPGYDPPLSVARLHQLESGVTVDYQQSTAESMAERRAGEFEIVTCLEMLEHVPDPSTVIQACADLCRSGGDLFFSTINRNPKSFLFAIVGAEYILNLLPRGTHEYDKFIKPSELARWIRGAGLDMQEVMGMTYNPLTKRYRLTPDDVSVNYLIRAKKP